VLKLISPLRPGLIEAGDDSGFLYLIMPIRIERLGVPMAAKSLPEAGPRGM
jgi:hypothetical protein